VAEETANELAFPDPHKTEEDSHGKRRKAEDGVEKIEEEIVLEFNSAFLEFDEGIFDESLLDLLLSFVFVVCEISAEDQVVRAIVEVLFSYSCVFCIEILDGLERRSRVKNEGFDNIQKFKRALVE
jgi:hypothetical protein